MKVDDVFCVSSLHADREGVGRVEGECDESSGAGWHGLAQHSGVYLEFEQSGISSIKSVTKKCVIDEL